MSHRKYRHAVSASVGAIAAILCAAPAAAEAGQGEVRGTLAESPAKAGAREWGASDKLDKLLASRGGAIGTTAWPDEANEACGALVDGEADCTADDGAFEQGIEYVADGDFTLRLEDGLTLNPEVGRGGVVAYSVLGTDGSVTIDGAGTAIHARNGTGVSVEASKDITLNLGTVTSESVTEGELAWGIATASQYGDTRITVGSVSAIGTEANAIRAETAFGNISVNAGSASTQGDFAPAIAVLNDAGFFSEINVGNLSTNGFSSDGIVAVGGASTFINVGSFETTGDYNWGANVYNISDTVGHHPDNYYYNEINFGSVKLTGTNNLAMNYVGYGRLIANVDNFESDGANNGVALLHAAASINIKVGNAVLRGENNGGIGAVAQLEDVYVDVGSIIAESGGGVSATAWFGNASVRAGTVRTAGDFYVGVGANAGDGGAVSIVSDEVGTNGINAHGIVATSISGLVRVDAGNVTTEGSHSVGVYSWASRGVVSVRGDVTTTGEESAGIIASGFTGDSVVHTQGSVTTSGDAAHGLWVLGRHGTAIVHTAGLVSTTGERAIGIEANGAAGDVRIDAADVTTSGTASHGIVATTRSAGISPASVPQALLGKLAGASNFGESLLKTPAPGGGISTQAFGDTYEGNIDIRAARVSVTGEGSHAITARGWGSARIYAGDLSSVSGQAIDTDMLGAVDIEVRGDATSRDGAAIVAKASDVAVLVTAQATVTGGGDAIVVNAVGPRCRQPLPDDALPGICPNPGELEPVFGPVWSIQADYGNGTASVVNRGVIEAADGFYAVRAEAGTVTLENHGEINGPVLFAGGDDLFDNRGVFLMTGNSDFGSGVDVMRNSGTLRLAGGNRRIDGLERFENSGLIDLGNSVVGDVLTLSGNYVGSGDAVVRLDIAGDGRTSDRLVVEGSASGSTRIALAARPTETKLTGSDGVVLIRVAGTTATDAFTLEENTRDIGLVRYTLVHDAASGSYRLIGAAGAGTYRLLGTMQGVDNVASASADLWRTQTLSRRDALLAGVDGAAVPRLWGALQGGRVSRDWSTGEGDEAIDLSHRQTRYGGQLGYDLFGGGSDGGAWRFGLTAGYTTSKLGYTGSTEKADLSTANVGAYAGYVGDRLFANLLVKYDRHDLKLQSAAFTDRQDLKGSSIGADAELGLRFGDAGMFIEPTVGLAWTSSRIDDIVSGTQSLEFENSTNVKGRIGARFGGTTSFANGGSLTLYTSGNAVRTFGGDYALTVTSGASQRIEGGRLGTYGEGRLGLSYRTAGGFQAFAEGQGEFGSGYNGLTGRVGFRIGF